MSNERKKVTKKPIPKAKPKPRVEVKGKKKPKPKPEPVVPPKERKPKSEDKYIRIAGNAKAEEFRAIGERVQRGEIKWAYYAVDGDKGYHHYIVL